MKNTNKIFGLQEEVQKEREAFLRLNLLINFFSLLTLSWKRKQSLLKLTFYKFTSTEALLLSYQLPDCNGKKIIPGPANITEVAIMIVSI